MDIHIHFPNAIEKFQALIEELKIQNLVTTQRLKEIMVVQTKTLVEQVKIIAKKTKAMVDHAHAVIVMIDK